MIMGISKMMTAGNQDTTTALWDIRKVCPTSGPVARLVGKMGAVRSLRFSPDGRFLAVAEPADFIHLYDVKSGLQQVIICSYSLESNLL
jgi:WD40 repeat protein